MSVNDNDSLEHNNDEIKQDVRHVASPGALLKQKRQSADLELSSIARELNLDTWMLEALESDDFSKFGAEVFAKGHLKHYAQHLGLVPDDVLFAYYQVAEHKETAPVITKSLSGATTKNKSYQGITKWFVRLLGLLAIAALAYGAYQGVMWWLNDARQNASPTTEIPLEPSLNTNSTNTGADASGANSLSTSLPNPLLNSPTNSSDLDESSNSGTNIALPTPVSGGVETILDAEQTQTTENTAVQNTSQTNSSTAAGQAELSFIFNESSWIEVFDESGNKLIYGMANEGTQRVINVSGPTEIFLGNAVGTIIKLNGSTYNIPSAAKAGRTARFVLKTFP